MKTVIPPKLISGDTIKVITPARSFSMSWLNNDELKQIASQRFNELRLNVTFGKYVYEIDEFDSSSIEHRVEDLHEAFADPKVKMLITVIGGFNSNQLLKYIDYGLIEKNPKIVCGFSDITALLNAIYAKTGMTTYLGPHYFNFGDRKSFDYSLQYFKKCLFATDPYEVLPSTEWSTDRWVGRQNQRNFEKNEGYWVINEGQAQGTIIGGNLCTFNLLQGTEFMPDLNDSILFVEDDAASNPATFDRDLQSVIQQTQFKEVRGIVIGRFEKNSNITRELLKKIIKTKKELSGLPIIANVDFGHTAPILTIPIGGEVKLVADSQSPKITILKH